MTTQQRNSEIEEFLATAFCIDGLCSLDRLVSIEDIKWPRYKLTDSRRGKFYVIITKEEN